MEKIDLENDSIGKLFLKYFIPTLLGMLMMSINIVIDGIFVGQGVGRDGLASVNIAFPIFMLFIGISLLLGIGASTIISVYYGEKKYEEAQNIFNQATFLGVVTALISMFLGLIYLEDIAYFLGSNDNLLPYVKDYIGILIMFAIPFILGDAFNCFVRNDENPNLVMYAMSLGAIINFILDYIFIFKFHWELKGASLATGIGQLVLFLVLLIHFKQKRGRLRFKFVRLNFKDVVRILKNGLPYFITEMSTGIVALVFNLVLMKLAQEVGVSAYSIINYVHSLVIMVFISVSQAVQPIISYNFGARGYERVKSIFKLAIKVSVFLGIFFYVVGTCFGKGIAMLFNNDDLELIKLTKTAINFYFIAYLFMGSNIVIAAFFQSMEKARSSTIISILRSFLLVILGLIILAKLLGVNGVWLATPFAEFLTLIVSIYLVKTFKINTNNN